MPSYIYLNLRTKRWQVGDKPKSSAAFPQVDSVTIANVTFRVSAAQRDWCLSHRMASGKPYKFVHAWAVGTVCLGNAGRRDGVAISYNVERGPFFYRKDTGAPITGADYVVFGADRTAIAYGVR